MPFYYFKQDWEYKIKIVISASHCYTQRAANRINSCIKGIKEPRRSAFGATSLSLMLKRMQEVSRIHKRGEPANERGILARMTFRTSSTTPSTSMVSVIANETVARRRSGERGKRKHRDSYRCNSKHHTERDFESWNFERERETC